jgi:hypothetical protein
MGKSKGRYETRGKGSRRPGGGWSRQGQFRRHGNDDHGGGKGNSEHGNGGGQGKGNSGKGKSKGHGH